MRDVKSSRRSRSRSARRPRRGHPVPHPAPVGRRPRQGLRDGVLRAHGRSPAHPLRPGHPRAPRDAGRRPAGLQPATLRRRPRRAARRTSRSMRAPRINLHRDTGEGFLELLSGVPSLRQRKPQEPTAIPVHQVRARRRSTGPRSGGPGRQLRSAKPAGATRLGHRRQTPARLEGGNGTPG